MALEVVVYYSKSENTAKVNAAYNTKSKQRLCDHYDVSLEIDGASMSRADYYLIEPYDKVKIGYRFEAEVYNPARELHISLLVGGRKTDFIIYINKFDIYSVSSSMAGNEDIILQYSGLALNKGEYLTVWGSAGGEDIGLPIGKWESLPSNEVRIPRERLLALNSNKVELGFFKSLTERFESNNINITISKKVSASPIFLGAP